MAFLIGNFLRSLEVCLNMVFQGASTSTDSLKMMLFLHICSIKAISDVDRVKPLEQLVEDFGKDVDQWRHLRHADLSSQIEEEFVRLTAQNLKAREETSK